MSSSGSQKKSPKEMIIEHGEKMLLGLVALFALICVATTQWGTYEKKPEEFLAKVETGKAAFASSTWPDEEKKKFEARDPGEEVAVLLDGIKGGPNYEYSVKWFHRITKAREKVQEPEYLAIEELVADDGRVLVELLPEEPETPEGVGPDIVLADAGDVKAAESEPVIEAPRGDVDGPRPTGVVGPRPGGTGATGGATEYAPEESYISGDGGEYAGSGESQYGSQRNVEARGARFVAVRGIFPMKTQVNKVQNALHLDTPLEAYMQVQFWDFEIQRQTATEGKNPWSGDWEPVDIDVAVKLLGRTEFDVDVVDEQYRDAVFTMPLPFRVTGSWGTAAGRNGILASHRQIKQLLNEKERLEQEARSAAAIKAAERDKKIKESAGGGFKQIQHDTRNIRNQLGSSSEGMGYYNEAYSQTMQEYDPEYEEESSGSYPGSGAYGSAQVVATPDLLLFRFLDFSVVPGNAYRYKARLKLLNPNFDRDPGELADFSSREGRFRYTPWSDISTAALVQDESEVYIAKVDARRGVSMDAYQWMSETGSYVHGPFEGLYRGDQVASWTREVERRRETVTEGGVFTDVLRPSGNTFMEEQIDYVTPYTLIDYSRRTILNPESHPDLELTTKRIPNTSQEVVMVNRFGDLVELDKAGQDAAYSRAKSRMEKQEELWGHLKRAVGPGGSPGDISELLYGSGEGEYGGGEYSDPSMMMEMMSGSTRRRGSNRRGKMDMQQMQMMMMQMESGGYSP